MFVSEHPRQSPVLTSWCCQGLRVCHRIRKELFESRCDVEVLVRRRARLNVQNVVRTLVLLRGNRCSPPILNLEAR